MSVEREVNKVLDKFHSLQSTNGKLLAEVQNILRTAKNELQGDGETPIGSFYNSLDLLYF